MKVFKYALYALATMPITMMIAKSTAGLTQKQFTKAEIEATLRDFDLADWAGATDPGLVRRRSEGVVPTLKRQRAVSPEEIERVARQKRQSRKTRAKKQAAPQLFQHSTMTERPVEKRIEILRAELNQLQAERKKVASQESRIRTALLDSVQDQAPQGLGAQLKQLRADLVANGRRLGGLNGSSSSSRRKLASNLGDTDLAHQLARSTQKAAKAGTQTEQVRKEMDAILKLRGDSKMNAKLQAAKKSRAFITREIKELERKLDEELTNNKK